MLQVNAAILNYNSRELLERFLPSVIEAARACRYPCRVTVLDNNSADDSVAFVRKNFPDVAVYQAKENRVLCSYNEWAASVGEEIILLLNNDLKLNPGCIDPLVAVFDRHPEAFFSASFGNHAKGMFRWGILEPVTHGMDQNCAGVTLSAGVAAFHRLRFLELGGFDELYLPGRYEDVDLCYRGWKKGWKGYYVPESVQEHLGGYSFDKKFGFKKTQRMVFRNSVLFMIKNISEPFYFFRFLMWLPIRLIVALLCGKLYLVQGFFDAAGRMKTAMQRRSQEAKNKVLTDSQVYALVNGSLCE